MGYSIHCTMFFNISLFSIKKMHEHIYCPSSLINTESYNMLKLIIEMKIAR